ncbi:MAG: DUF4193 family protein [Acidimicrobiales bacterium]|jgi:hypothetical protein
MASDGDTEEVFDEEELAEGFDEEIVVDEDDLEEVDDVEGVLDVEVIDVEDEVIAEVAIPDDDDVADDADVELALDEVLAETIRRSSTPEDDDEAPGEIDPLVDPAETILPKQDDEFRCSSCRLLKKTTQLADRGKMLCRDCV